MAMTSDSINSKERVRHRQKAVKYERLDYKSKCLKCLGCQLLEVEDFYGVKSCRYFKSHKPVSIEQV